MNDDADLDTRPGYPGPVDDLDQARRRRHGLAWVSGLGVMLVITLPLAIGVGSTGIDPGTVAKIVFHNVLGWPQAPSWSDAQDSIVWLVRTPRVLLGAVVGAALAIAGVARRPWCATCSPTPTSLA